MSFGIRPGECEPRLHLPGLYWSTIILKIKFLFWKYFCHKTDLINSLGKLWTILFTQCTFISALVNSKYSIRTNTIFAFFFIFLSLFLFFFHCLNIALLICSQRHAINNTTLDVQNFEYINMFTISNMITKRYMVANNIVYQFLSMILEYWVLFSISLILIWYFYFLEKKMWPLSNEHYVPI